MRRTYRPMLAKDAKAPFSSDEWIFEVKWDGIRAISYVNDDLSIRSRNDKELRQSFPELEELKTLAQNVVLDGEIVVMRSGRPDFQAILERSKADSAGDITHLSASSPATYIVFDILECGGESLIDRQLIQRKRVLSECMREGEHVILSVFVEGDGEDYYEAALKRGVEGVIAKRVDSRYEPGTRSGSWLKIKKLQTCECVVFGYTAGRGSRAGTFGALVLGLYDEGRPVYIGKVGTGFKESDQESLMRVFQDLKSAERTLEGVDLPEDVTWLVPKLVCEVAYQNVTREGRLRMPRFRGIRTDKNPRECTVDQIRPMGLSAYESKRDFSATTEPKGGEIGGEGDTFVVQEHHARRLHFDLRLEKDGVLRSWAVPKGIPEKPGERRLAVETEDHPLEYAQFEGTIPEGQYGAGKVSMWDRGTYKAKAWEGEKIEFNLNGGRLRGMYVLVRLKKAGEKEWLLLRAKDDG